MIESGFRRHVRYGAALVLLSLLPGITLANIWQSTFGQRWFYESAAYNEAELAGTWWEASLQPGKSYTLSFNVTHIDGAMVVHIGNLDTIRIDKPGPYSYDFNITDGSRRRMMFTALGRNVTAGVNKILVAPRTASPGGTGPNTAGTWMPRGHYLAFARERDLNSEVLQYIDQPWTSPSNWHTNVAQDIHDALTLSAVKGFSVEMDWRTLEVGDGVYNWDLIDANLKLARRVGKKLIVNVAHRSFDGESPMPRYFPSRHSVWVDDSGGRGFVAKLWDPWVSSRLIRLYTRIARRYASENAFGGIATTETAVGTGNGNYSLAAYKQALAQIVTQTDAALSRGKLFLYLNFIRGGDRPNLRHDARVSLLKQVPHGKLAIGAPDITPDRPGMPGSVNNYRIHVRKTMGNVEQFCHLQHTDHGMGGVNVKSNQHRLGYANDVRRQREREKQPWYSGMPAVFEFSDLAEGSGGPVELHPNWRLGELWHPRELFQFAVRNFGCDYMFWHYRENVRNDSRQYWWEDVRPIITNNPNF